MRNVLFASVFSLATSALVAGPIITVEESDRGGLQVFTFSIDPDGEDFQTFQIDIDATSGDFQSPLSNPPNATFNPVSTETGFIGTGTVTAGFTFLGASVTESTVFGAFGSGSGIPASNFSGPIAQVVGTDLAGTYEFLFSDGGGAPIDSFATSGTFGAAVPEPASLALVGLGIAGVVARRRRV